MPLELANNISQLDENWPNGGDSIDKGDDHIRLLKSVIKTAFQGPDGEGFAEPLTVDPKVLNELAKTIEDLKKSIAEVYPVGSIIFRDDGVDPTTLYPGTTWVLVSADATIGFGTDKNVGKIEGNNTPAVPLLQHEHSITINGVGDHVHSGNVGLSGFSFEHHQYNSRMQMENWTKQTGAAGAHTHTATIGKTGTADPKIDVRGARRFFCVWKRVK